MRTRYPLVMLTIVIGLGVLLAGCGQSEEETASSGEHSGEGCSVACESKGDGMECAVTCSGVEGRETTCTVTCEHAEDGTCTITCGGETVTCERAEDGTCTTTCGGQTITCEMNEDGTCTITCDGKTMTGDHAAMSGCPGAKTADAGGCPGMAESGESGGCPGKRSGSCPGSGASKVAEEEAS